LEIGVSPCLLYKPGRLIFPTVPNAVQLDVLLFSPQMPPPDLLSTEPTSSTSLYESMLLQPPLRAFSLLLSSARSPVWYTCYANRSTFPPMMLFFCLWSGRCHGFAQNRNLDYVSTAIQEYARASWAFSSIPSHLVSSMTVSQSFVIFVAGVTVLSASRSLLK
jgi:hypothetical protein